MRLVAVALSMFLFTPPAWSSAAEWSNAMFERCVHSFASRLDLPTTEARLVARRLCTHARVFWPFVEMQDYENFERLSPTTAVKGPLLINIVGRSLAINDRARSAIDHVLRPASLGALDWSDVMTFADPETTPGPAHLVIFMDACEPELLASAN